MSRRIDAETRAKIVAAYLENDEATYKEIGKRFGINPITIGKILKAELEAGNGIKPDRRAKPEPPDYMQYVTPLAQRKHELEQKF
jgi:transposase-like protein